ncbi:bifunctional diguanylate cyclase/phosphodiesterase [Pseudoalteromonas carrageenovora]|uniref:bifunctional diguanylate cyclase/phosphodiesterase n=1 Tax=Pseudoalteromonas carrageenovora TaxID=227 RepID=UPI0026E37CF7|nr:bifunctional diguanylate cyclase/phosphodiesterase [Pseudoalteromonas carrageenovora]MDO6546253.1 EAL domain-containing protein [Pseudoalteromonas carrageenovora]MDO6833463.1 EAL domain-containing protein [Pseudoalteromonas carrageenovora]
MKSDNPTSNLTHQFVINDYLHQLFDAVNVISVQGYDNERRVIYWNEGSERLYGYTKEEAIGKKIEDLIIPEPMCEFVIEAHSDWVKKDIEIPASEIILQDKDGNNVSVFSSHVMFTNQYNTKQMYCIDIDLSDVKKAQAEASFNEDMLKTIFGAIPDLFFLMENDGTILEYHASNETDLYTKPKQFIGKKMGDVLPEEVAKKFETYISLVLEKEQMMSFKYELALPHGLVFFEARINKITEHNQLMVIIRDITEQHKSDEIIRHQAYYDSLTLLPNRFLALDRLSQLLIEAQRNNEKAAVLFLDLDDFKKINDSLGHETGDKLLIESAQRLQKALRKDDTVGRLGGDEFIVWLRGITDHHAALKITEKLLNNFRAPFKIEGREHILTASIGVAIYPENGTTVADLLRNADTAMYQAKSYGRNTYSFFTKKMNVIIQRRLVIEEQMRDALERNEFELFYQPQFDAKNKHIIGAEALLRWHNPVLGNVTPDEFIPIAENTGLIVPIGKFVISQALHFLNTWQSTCKRQQKYTMAVNLSPRQFRDVGLLSFIQNSLSEANVNPESLELEITEGVLMSCHTNVVDILTEITALGIYLSMDDFGTGYSSLSYLREYPFNVLKIDRSFIDGIVLNNEDCNLVKAIIAMSHSLGLTVVAEGVETKEQHTLLNELGCDFMQGFYFSKPIPAKQFLDFSMNFDKQ